MKPRIGTIKDIAAKTGVSISTVSRVINNNYPVSEDIRKRVLEIVEMVNYKPNSVAKSLRSKKSSMIGLVVADIANHYFMHLAKGLESVVSESGYHIVMANSDGNLQKERQLLSALLEERPAAVVVTAFDSSPRHLQDFLDTNIPVVMVDRYIKGVECDEVVSNNFEIAHELTSLLLRQGHREIAIANVMLSTSTGRERYEGYLAALDQYGLKPSARFVSSGGFDSEVGREWVRTVFSAGDRPTALLCANNVMTIGALRAFRDLSLRIPRDVSVVSIGMIPLCDLIEPRITSALHDGFRMGVVAGEMVMNRIAQGLQYKSRREIVPMPISSTRDSIAPPSE